MDRLITPIKGCSQLRIILLDPHFQIYIGIHPQSRKGVHITYFIVRKYHNNIYNSICSVTKTKLQLKGRNSLALQFQLQIVFIYRSENLLHLDMQYGFTHLSYVLIFLCNGIRWPLFYFLHHNLQSLLIIFVHWTQLSGYWTHDTNYMVWNISMHMQPFTAYTYI